MTWDYVKTGKIGEKGALQPAMATKPLFRRGASDRNRTRNPLITNQTHQTSEQALCTVACNIVQLVQPGCELVCSAAFRHGGDRLVVPPLRCAVGVPHVAGHDRVLSTGLPHDRRVRRAQVLLRRIGDAMRTAPRAPVVRHGGG